MDEEYVKSYRACSDLVENVDQYRRLCGNYPKIDPITLVMEKHCRWIINCYQECCELGVRTPGISEICHKTKIFQLSDLRPPSEPTGRIKPSVKYKHVEQQVTPVNATSEPVCSNVPLDPMEQYIYSLSRECRDCPDFYVVERMLWQRYYELKNEEIINEINEIKKAKQTISPTIAETSISPTVAETAISPTVAETVISPTIVETDPSTLLEQAIDNTLVYIFNNVFPIERLSSELPYFNLNNYSGILFEIFLIFSVSFFLIYLVCIDYKFNYKIYLTKLASDLFIFILFLSFLILNNVLTNYYVFDYLIIQDSFGVFVKNILIFSLLFCIIISRKYVKIEKLTHYEYFLLIALSLIGIITMINANDLGTLYIGIELQSLAFYLLAAFKVYSNFSTEAGLKYFILGAFSSGLLLFGCSLIYGFTGTTNLTELHLLFLSNDVPSDIFNGILLGNIFITIAILFKLGAAPFHMWLPDVYDGAPTSVTAIFSIVPKIAIFTLFIRLTINLFCNTFFFWHQLLVYAALLSIIIGTFGALYQVKIKKLLAYSAISHVGFLLIGFSSYNIIGFFALFFYIIVYILISLNFFAIILNVRKLDNNLKIKKINEYVLLFKSNKVLAFNFCILLFSIAGIPPLLGFFSKLYIFKSAIHADLYLVTIIAAIFSVIACLYYIRLIKLLFFKRFDYWLFLYEVPKSASMLISITLILNILFFFYPEIFTIYIYNNILQFFIENNIW